MKQIISIFTATYNRGYILPCLYQSLINQTVNNFEWILINDGSTDETDDLVKKWIADNKIDIHYIRLSHNGGIANAMNKGISNARGFLFFKVDSDDVLEKNAVERILKFEESIPTEEKNNFAGVSGMRFYKNGRNIGHEWQSSEDYVDATNFQRKRLNLNGDKAEAYYTHILREYGPFPDIEGEKYAFEGILWDRIAHSGLKLRWYKDKIYRCEYLPDGETNNYYKNCRRNFRAYSYWVNEYVSYREVPFLDRFVVAAKYFAVRHSIKINKSKKKELLSVKPAWLIGAKIFGLIIYTGRIIIKPHKYKNLEKIIVK